MKALFLNGSARGEKGITSKLLDSLSGGMSRAGVATAGITINKLDISPCKACLYCMHKNPGRCVQNDDMESVYAEMKRSDIVVFGSPVYLDGITAQLKTVIDRLVCCMEPFLTTDDAGFTRHTFSWRLPKEFIVLSTCGFPEAVTFSPLVTYFEALSRNVGSKLAAGFYIPGSIAIQVKPGILTKKLELLDSAGFQYGKNGFVDAALVEEVNKPLIDKEEYLTLARQYEHWCRTSREKYSAHFTES